MLPPHPPPDGSELAPGDGRAGLTRPPWMGLFGLERKDWPDAVAGFLTLLFAIAGHAVLEAARDALFLQRLPPSRLPWAYLTISALTLGGGLLGRHVTARISRRSTLCVSLLGGAAVTSLFSLQQAWLSSAVALSAFYVWTGVFATSIVVQFWLLIGELMDFGQAKRSYALLGGGALLGAVTGSALASGALLFASPRALPLLGAALFSCAAIFPLRFSAGYARSRAGEPPARAPLGGASGPLGDAYVRRLLSLVLISTVAMSVSDYVFKSVVVREVAKEELPRFFARYYGCLNLLALCLELLVTPRLLRGGIHRLVLSMPLLVVLSSAGFLLSGTLLSVLVLKGVDGSLRHSVNRIGSEMLYLPLGVDARQRVRAVIEALGLRGGQALASVLVLSAAAMGVGIATFGWMVVTLSAVWLLIAARIEGPYVRRFRAELMRRSSTPQAALDRFDLSSLEALLRALNSSHDCDVIMALETFARWDKGDLVPVNILDHPSSRVVLQGLRMLGERPGLDAALERLLERDDPAVRAAALRYAIAHGRGEEFSLRVREDPDPGVRATELLGRIRARGGASASEELLEIATGSEPSARRALAEGLLLLAPPARARVVEQLIETGDGAATARAANALARSPHVEEIPVLIRLLGHREPRSDARVALTRLGEPALHQLILKLEDPLTPLRIRRHLPRTICRFGGARAAQALERTLLSETDEIVLLKTLRALARMLRENPTLSLSRSRLERAARRMLGRAQTLVAWRRTISGAALLSPATELLSRVLRQQEEQAVERVLRLLHILEPHSGMLDVSGAVVSGDPDRRARGTEVLQHLAPRALRGSLLELLEASREEPGPALPEAFAACLNAMDRDANRILRKLARVCSREFRRRDIEVSDAT